MMYIGFIIILFLLVMLLIYIANRSGKKGKYRKSTRGEVDVGLFWDEGPSTRHTSCNSDQGSSGSDVGGCSGGDGD